MSTETKKPEQAVTQEQAIANVSAKQAELIASSGQSQDSIQTDQKWETKTAKQGTDAQQAAIEAEEAKQERQNRDYTDNLLKHLLSTSTSDRFKGLQMRDRIMLTSKGHLFCKVSEFENRSIVYVTVQLIELAIVNKSSNQTSSLRMTGNLSLPPIPSKLVQLSEVIKNLAGSIQAK